MKTTLLILCLSGVAAFTAWAAASSSKAMPLLFLESTQCYEAVKKELGAEVASSVITDIDLKKNTITLDAGNPQAAKVSELIAKLDHRPETMVVSATVSRVTPAVGDTPEKRRVISRPTLYGMANQPMKISFDDANQGKLEVEILVRPVKGE